MPATRMSVRAIPAADCCILFKVRRTSSGDKKTDGLDHLFHRKTFWIGQDNCQIHNTMEQLFQELKEQKTGYTVCVETLLRQLIVQMIRNYQGGKNRCHFSPATPAEAQDFIIEESFWLPVSHWISFPGDWDLGADRPSGLCRTYTAKHFCRKKEMPACRLHLFCSPIQTAAYPPLRRSWGTHLWSISP